ncbi:hypothetical protein ACS0TY_006068 [Phlomoides rotata]
MVAKRQIELLTAQAWYSENQELENKIAKMSVQNAIVSEYTDMVLTETLNTKAKADSTTTQKLYRMRMQTYLYEGKKTFCSILLFCSSCTFYACRNFLPQL